MSACWTVNCGDFSVDVSGITKAGGVMGGGYRFVFRLPEYYISGNFVAEKSSTENGIFFPEECGAKIYAEWLEYRDFVDSLRFEKSWI